MLVSPLPSAASVGRAAGEKSAVVEFFLRFFFFEKDPHLSCSSGASCLRSTFPTKVTLRSGSRSTTASVSGLAKIIDSSVNIIIRGCHTKSVAEVCLSTSPLLNHSLGDGILEKMRKESSFFNSFPRFLSKPAGKLSVGLAPDPLNFVAVGDNPPIGLELRIAATCQ
jgi:hypothetical protein